jgi:glycosyltransferase involved in cell wall biosynthesis
VTTFHDLFVLSAEYSTAEFRRRFAEQARAAADSSDIIIAVSHFTARQVQEHLGVDQKRIRVVHHGVHAPPKSFARMPEKLVLHVGALQTRKNITRLVAAFEKLPSEWTLVLAGSAGYGYEAIVDEIRKSRVAQRIRLTGYVTQPQLEQLYARAAMFAFPSLDEGFGFPVLEAMARGIPVITSARSALKEVAGDAALLVDPEQIDSIADALVRLTRDPGMCNDLVARGYRRAQEFTWASAIGKIWSVYQEVGG